MTMTHFFANAGQLLNHVIREEGDSPRKSFVSCFTYEFGYAEYVGNGRDGRWTFKLN